MNFLRNMSNQGAIRSAEAEASAGPAAPIIKQGLMRKQGGSVKSWKERWFTLTKDHLSYYKSRDDKEPIDAIPVNKIRVCQREETDTRNPSQFPHYFSVDVGHRVYVIGARSEADRDEWVEEISKLVRELNKDLPTLPSDLRTSSDNIAVASDAGSIRSAHSNSALNTLGTAPAVTPTATAAAAGSPAPAAAAPAVAKPRVLLTGTVHKKDFDAKEYVASLRALVRLENYSDVVLSPATGNERYPAHRPVLAARAPVRARSWVRELEGRAVPLTGYVCVARSVRGCFAAGPGIGAADRCQAAAPADHRAAHHGRVARARDRLPVYGRSRVHSRQRRRGLRCRRGAQPHAPAAARDRLHPRQRHRGQCPAHAPSRQPTQGRGRGKVSVQVLPEQGAVRQPPWLVEAIGTPPNESLSLRLLPRLGCCVPQVQ